MDKTLFFAVSGVCLFSSAELGCSGAAKTDETAALVTECGTGGAPEGGGQGGGNASGGAGQGGGNAHGSSGGGGSGGAASQPECLSHAQCPVPADECMTATCIQGICGEAPLPFGKPIAAQKSGDCTLVVCDGSGAIVQIADPFDPEDDGSECTSDFCAGMSVEHTNVPAGVECTPPGGGTGHCDGGGTCEGGL